jgi:hypothetical protein
VITPEPEPPQPEISSNTGAANDPLQTRVHLHETSKNSSTRIPILPFIYDAGRAFPAVVSAAVK